MVGWGRHLNRIWLSCDHEDYKLVSSFIFSNLVLKSPESDHLSKSSFSRPVLTRGKLDSHICHMRPNMGTKYM